MTFEGLTPEEVSIDVKLGERLGAWTSRNQSALSTIEGTFVALNAEIAKFESRSDTEMGTYLEAKKTALKLAMYNIYMKY
jgi:hypothetical protein